jgi:two-component system, response regulator YesN
MNIFLVEDEHWALAELVELFKNYEPDHQVFAFDNGDDALSAAERIRPQLVLTDINMPGIDGLELIEKLSQIDTTIKSMILSVHDQFEYARQGMKFGVFDYLLKPVKKEVLFRAVETAIQQIEIESKRREEWMNGTIAQMLLSSDILENGDHVMNGRAYCMVTLILEHGTMLKDWKDTCICFHELKKRFTCKAPQEGEIYCVDLDCRQRVILIPLADTSHVSDIINKLSLLHQQLQRLSTAVHMGLTVKSENNTLYETFLELKQNMDEHMLFGMSTFVSTGMKTKDADNGSIWGKVRVMETHFKKGNILKGQTVLYQLLEELRKKQITKLQLRLFINDMMFSLKYNLLASNKRFISINDLQEDISMLNRFAGYGELYEWLNEKIVSLYCGQEPKDVNPKGLVLILLQLIHKNYQGCISLQQFAADHHVSLGYMSRMFKSQTGRTFSDYISGYRINKAKELLTGGVERLQEVSHLVGYGDTKHFSALFKKIVGETPLTYAKRNKGKIPPIN